VLRWILLPLTALALVAAGTVLGAEHAPDAVTSYAVHGWLPWAIRGEVAAGLILIAWLGVALGRGRTWLGRAIALLGAAAIVIPVSIVATLWAGSADHADLHSGLDCGLSDNEPGCHNFVYAGYAVTAVFAELVALGLLLVLGLALAVRDGTRGARARRAPSA